METALYNVYCPLGGLVQLAGLWYKAFQQHSHRVRKESSLPYVTILYGELSESHTRLQYETVTNTVRGLCRHGEVQIYLLFINLDLVDICDHELLWP